VDIKLANGHKKIWILGAVASGKTTLAKALSESNYCYQYELDNLVYVRRKSGNIRRSPEDVKYLIERINRSESWIVEGVYRDDYKILLELSDLILVLDTPIQVRNDRILTRWAKQRYGFESCHYEPTIIMLKSMFEWSRGYDEDYSQLLDLLSPYKHKVQIVDLSDS